MYVAAIICSYFFPAPRDYSSVTDLIVTFQPSERQRMIEIVIVNDALAEDDETFALSLSLPEGSDGAALGSTIIAIATIIDDDGMQIGTKVQVMI